MRIVIWKEADDGCSCRENIHDGLLLVALIVAFIPIFLMIVAFIMCVVVVVVVVVHSSYCFCNTDLNILIFHVCGEMYFSAPQIEILLVKARLSAWIKVTLVRF